MSSQISVSDLSEQAKERLVCAMELIDKRDIFKARLAELKKNQAPEGKIEDLSNNITLITQNIEDLIQQASELHAKEVTVIINDLDDANSKIKASTDKVNNAVKKLNNIKSILTIVKQFLDLGNAIIGALAKANPVAQVAGIIQAIDTFTQQQSTSTSRDVAEPE